MCLGSLFSAPKMPAPPPRQQPAPTMKAAAPPPEYVAPEDIKEKEGEEKLSTRKKKILEIKKTKEGVKQFGAIDPTNLPNTPEGGVNIPK